MDTAIVSKEIELVLTNYNGLRIDNQNNNCYLNTAVNNICCNDIIMTEVNNRPSLREWLEQMLLDHKPECTLETIPNAYHDFIAEFRRFLASSTGCIPEHGVECFTNLREDYINKEWSDSILKEIVTIANSEEVSCVMALKAKLAGKYPNTPAHGSLIPKPFCQRSLKRINSFCEITY